MKNSNFTFLSLLIAVLVVVVSTQGALGVETPLTDYSRAVMLENPTYYWTFNEAGATDVSQEVMRYETEGEMIACLDATRVAGYSAELGNAASFNDNSVFWAEMVNRGNGTGAYAIEYWVKAGAGAGYLANISVGNGDSPGIIHGFSANQTELWYGGARTGGQSQLNFSDGQWHHVVLAVNYDADPDTADQVDIAVDGVVTIGVTSLAARQLNLTASVNIGACKPTSVAGVNDAVPGPEAGGVWDGFQGDVDEFAIYDLAGMDAAAVAAKVGSLAGHYALATTPTAITPFAAVAADEVSYAVISGNPVNATYNDATGSELSDATYAGSAYLDNMVAYSGTEGYTELEFDLGGSKTLDAIWIDYAGPGGSWGINAPDSVELSFSTDGVNFSTPVTFSDFNNATDPDQSYFNERRAQVDVDVEAQYVRAKFSTNGTFVFLSEVQFMEELSALIAGDANNDGKVDGSDVTILANNWQFGVTDGGATWDMGDFNGDGKVDGSDVTILANNWQFGVGSAAAAVPEPGTIILLISAVASLLIWRRVR